MSDINIQGVSENVFRSFIKKKVKENHLQILDNLKRKHSKSTFLECKELKLAGYLEDSRFSTEKKQLLFKLRSKTLDVKQNFKSAYQNPWCLSCGLFPESQDHILQCPELTQKLFYIKGKTSKLSGNDVYKSLDKQLVITNIYSDLLDIREVSNRNEIQ